MQSEQLIMKMLNLLTMRVKLSQHFLDSPASRRANVWVNSYEFGRLLGHKKVPRVKNFAKKFLRGPL